MQTFRPEDLESDILNDLIEEINELYESSEQTLIELELRPDDNELQRALFRSVHTIKGDLGLVGFLPMIPILQHVEDLLDYLRKGQMEYSSLLSDLVLLSMDVVKRFVESVMKAGQAEYDPDLETALVSAIEQITPENQADHELKLINAVKVLNPNLVVEEGSQGIEVKPPEDKAVLSKSGIPKDLSAEKQLDLLFFRDMMMVVEKRSNYWKGKGDRVAKLAQFINQTAGKPIEEDQLAVACYTHDFGMAFMPISLLHKKESYSDAEFNLMRSHVYKSARLLEHLNQWDAARKMILQVHERVDGSGYPLGIKETDICDGAKLLAILDTFDALTHSRSHNGEKLMSKKKAVIEINRSAKGQFSMKWMRHFNMAMTKLLAR
jgi:HD-GYP domain-containing protein (c-di-GMP phosphodiesterase class II)